MVVKSDGHVYVLVCKEVKIERECERSPTLLVDNQLIYQSRLRLSHYVASPECSQKQRKKKAKKEMINGRRSTCVLIAR